MTDVTDVTDVTDQADQAAETATEPTHLKGAALLDKEGDVAADYLEGLLDIADLDGDIDIDVEGNRAMVSVVEANPGELRHLVGHDGRVLDALQELTRLAATRETGERSRLMLDVAGHRAARRAELVTLAEEAVAEVQRTSAPVRMAPMTPFERKVVHDVVADAGLTSESEGDEPSRRVVIRPA
jgi:spoIIIJ-associated protein